MKSTDRRRSAVKKLTAAELREMILKVATSRFAEVGFHGSSMRDIATELNITAAAIYHHFKDKNALYLSVCKQAFEERATTLDHALASSESAVARIQAFTETLVRTLEEDAIYFKLLQRELMERSFDEIVILIREDFLPQFSRLTELMDQTFPDRNASRAAFNIYALALGYAQLKPVRTALPSHIDLGTDATAVARLIVACVLPGAVLS